MTRGRGGQREAAEDIASLIIHNGGRKAVKDVDLAPRFGLTVEQLYRRLGRKLLLFSRSSWFEVEPEKRQGSQRSSRPAIAFTQGGVIMVSAALGIERAVAAGMVSMLKTRRRSSKNRQRRPRRANDPPREAKYQTAFARLKAEIGKRGCLFEWSGTAA